MLWVRVVRLGRGCRGCIWGIGWSNLFFFIFFFGVWTGLGLGFWVKLMIMLGARGLGKVLMLMLRKSLGFAGRMWEKVECLRRFSKNGLLMGIS
jgi:hypothetical protein